MARRSRLDRAKEPASELSHRLSGAGWGFLTLLAAYLVSFPPLLLIAVVSSVVGTKLPDEQAFALASPLWLFLACFGAHRMWSRWGHPARGVAVVLLPLGAGIAVAVSPLEPVVGRFAGVYMAVVASSLAAGAALYPRPQPRQDVRHAGARRVGQPAADTVAAPAAGEVLEPIQVIPPAPGTAGPDATT